MNGRGEFRAYVPFRREKKEKRKYVLGLVLLRFPGEAFTVGFKAVCERRTYVLNVWLVFRSNRLYMDGPIFIFFCTDSVKMAVIGQAAGFSLCVTICHKAPSRDWTDGLTDIFADLRHSSTLLRMWFSSHTHIWRRTPTKFLCKCVCIRWERDWWSDAWKMTDCH